MAYSSLGTSINFINRTTIVPVEWGQDVNNVVYGLLGNGTNAPTSVADILTSLGINTYANTRTVVVATLGQTIFNVGTYVPNTNSITVYINGVRQIASAYSESSSSIITFVSGAVSAGDIYEFVVNTVLVNGGYSLPTASAGVLGGVKVGTGLSIDGAGVLSVSSSGTVTSVSASSSSSGLSISGSPITSSGTLVFGLNTELNGLSGLASTGMLARTNTGTYATRAITAGAGISLSNGDGVAGNPTVTNTGVTSIIAGTNVTISGATGAVTINASGGGGSGTVTSVGLSLPAFLSVSGSPVTTAGTLTATLASQTQNQMFASPDGSPGAPAFRAMVAADLPTVTTAKGGTGLTSIGTASQILGVNTGGTGLEYKTITAGTNITITPSAGAITIAATGGGSGIASVNDDVLFWMSI